MTLSPLKVNFCKLYCCSELEIVGNYEEIERAPFKLLSWRFASHFLSQSAASLLIKVLNGRKRYLRLDLVHVSNSGRTRRSFDRVIQVGW